MKIEFVKKLELPGVYVIRLGRFGDNRGYFMETMNAKEVEATTELEFLKGINWVQFNESYAKKGVIKGMHFQWDPPLGKLLRNIEGRMTDMMLDIRKNSPTYGKIILHELNSSVDGNFNEWLWLPPGIAHGGFFTEDSVMEYFFSAPYNKEGEAGISPLSEDFDWQLADENLQENFRNFLKTDIIISEKDKGAFSLREWEKDPRSEKIYA